MTAAQAHARNTKIARAKQDANQVLNFLASLPSGNATARSREVVRQIMLQTGGRMMACGSYYDIRSKHLGGGVYRVTLAEAKS